MQWDLPDPHLNNSHRNLKKEMIWQRREMLKTMAVVFHFDITSSALRNHLAEEETAPARI